MEPMSDARLADARRVVRHQRDYVAGVRGPAHEIDLLAALEDLLTEVERLRAREAALVKPMRLLLALVRDEENGEDTPSEMWEVAYNELKQARALLSASDATTAE